MDNDDENQHKNNAANQQIQIVHQQNMNLHQGKRRGTATLQQSNGPPPHFYTPDTSVLSIGDGDLSFSLSVSQWVNYKYKKNIHKFVATTYDSQQQLEKLYKLNVCSNINKLKENGVKVIHGIDVNILNEYANIIDPQKQGFDRIIWNFPHAGFPQKSYGPGFEWEQQFHEKHINIIDNFFKHAKMYKKQGGLILMAHKTVQPFSIWNIVGIAQKNNLKLISKQAFNIDDYPGYENRRGAGKNGGKRFPIQDAVQYVFS